MDFPMDFPRGASRKIETTHRRLAWPLCNDDNRKNVLYWMEMLAIVELMQFTYAIFDGRVVKY